MDLPTIAELKQRFAEARLKGMEPFEAACAAVPKDVSEMLGLNRWDLSRDWVKDPEVTGYLGSSGAPTKEQFQAELWSAVLATKDGKAKAALAKVLAESAGWIQKEAKPIEVKLPGVMRIPTASSDAAWEAAAAKQQSELQKSGSTSH